MAAIIIACKSPPATGEQFPAEEEIVPEPKEEVSAPDSFTISQEMYDSTLAEVKIFVDNLNALIRHKDYEGWKAALSNEYFARISSPEFLARASESAMLKAQKRVLKTPHDYFLYVVVPSRSNSRVDEIEFTAADRVKVFYLEERKRNNNNVSTVEVRRLRLYELIKHDDMLIKSGNTDNTWKIVD